jgi:hypothetical protein
MRYKLPQFLMHNFLLAGVVLNSGLVLPAQAKPLFGTQSASVGEVLEISSQDYRCQGMAGGKLTIKTELFFGLSKPAGLITNAEFQQFLDREVTLRFPNGLTLLEGQGQFRNAGGKIIGERSRVLILLYPLADNDSYQKIEEIRAKYQRDFQQESVLRIDEKICAAF